MQLSRIQQMLTDARCLLADGAMGSVLYDMGLAVGTAPELWLQQHPERVAAVHRAYVAAGCDIILTNSFGANRRRLSHCGLEEQVHALNKAAAQIARGVVEADATHAVLVAGTVGPLWDVTDWAAATHMFEEQMQALAAGGVDLIWIETMTVLGEMQAAARAAARTGLPFIITASFERDGRTRVGHTAAEVALTLAGLEPLPFAIGCNCGVGPAATLDALRAMHTAAPNMRLVAKSNAGLPEFAAAKAHYHLTPTDMAAHAQGCRKSGAIIIGGCCGTTPAHLAAMRVALDSGH